MTTLSLSSVDLVTLPTDTLVIGVAPKSGRSKGVVLVGPATKLRAVPRRKVEDALVALGATGKVGELSRIVGAGISTAKVIVAVGLGAAPVGGYTDETLRRVAGSTARALSGTRKAAFALPADTAAQLEAVATGVMLGAYQFNESRSATLAALQQPLKQAAVVVADAKDAANKATLARAGIVANAVNLARDLINTPPNLLPPAALAEAAVAAVDGLPVEVEILDETALLAGGYGGIMGVGQGSARPPRLVRMTYRPEGATKHLALVGKGITFDTGGISIKPSMAMHEMKGDMGGAAAVIAATAAIARLGVPVNVTTYAACAENMPGGAAQRPGDVISIYGGRTVEVLDTDAEGRLVLADALVRAQQDAPDVIVDAATLTGAQVVALGSRTSGIMSNNDEFRSAVHAAATMAGETMWPMPLPEELRPNLDSLVADIANIPMVGRREAGMMSAAWFLNEFVAASQLWAHLDIAGPSYNSGGPYGYTPKGGTGAAVRTFLQLAEDLADGTL
jgi:leucyl aminopeptidase